MLEAGDLVLVANTVNVRLNGTLARVEYYNSSTDLAEIKLLSDKEGKFLNRRDTIRVKQTYLTKLIVEMDYTDLIDMSIDTNDKEWFYQLTSRGE
ncbi:IDEAL domain-containing protein [Priestia aryabhattai]|uniref:IDEAL domain-containing protein n=1 Tax=Priestia aryabhattai TaxID=412384 RepID=UPI0023AF5A7E|nr:hypothetical protein [Priestia aryabhattai]MDE8676472.1 hypothetical protein [Priestia aryabhattai]